MGLDTVVLILAVEETFEIEIPDAVAARLFTVGDLHTCVVERVNLRSDLSVDPSAIFVRLRDVIWTQLGVKPDDVVPAARFVEDFRAD